MLRTGESVRRRATGSILEMPTIFKAHHCAPDLYTDVFGKKEGTMWHSGARDTARKTGSKAIWIQVLGTEARSKGWDIRGIRTSNTRRRDVRANSDIIFSP